MYEVSVRMAAPSRPQCQSWRIFRSHRFGMIGLATIVSFGLMAMSHPLMMSTIWDRARFDPIVGFDSTYFPHPSGPSPTHFLGTDDCGRMY